MPQNSQPISFYKNTKAYSYSMHKSQFSISRWQNNYLHAMPNADYQNIDLEAPQTKHKKYYLNELGGLTIEELLNLSDLIMIDKCIDGLAPNYLSSKLYKRSDTHAYNTRLKEHQV